MGDIQNLTGSGAIDKIKEMADGKICLFCTYENEEIASRPMATQKVEDDGTLWFLSCKNSVKNDQLLSDNRVCLMYIDTSKQHYLSLSGNTEIEYDKEKIEELWNPMIEAWFKKDDPDLTLLKVTPDHGYYWDTKNGKLVTTLKVAIAAITGSADDDSIEGKLDI